MAKASAAPAPAPAPQVAKPTIGGSAVKNIQSIASERDVEVVEWGNGEPVYDGGGDTAPPAMAREGNIADGPVKVKPNPGEPDHEDTERPTGAGAREPETTEEPAAAAPEESSVEKRERALERLAAEKRSRDLEAQVKKLQEGAVDLDKLTLGDILKRKGVAKEALLEKLLAGTDDLGELPKPLEGDAKTLADLKTTVDELKAEIKKRDEAAAEQRVQDGLRYVREQLADTGVPLIEMFDGYGHVMDRAYALWQANGSKGAAADHLPQAAADIETALRKKHPKAAALADAAAKAGTRADAAAAVTPTRPAGITRRVAARPDSKPAPLPLDPQERDAAIKKEFGWT